jgi:hypothetical protein
MLVDDGTQGLSYEVIGIAIGVHKKYGPGLLEKRTYGRSSSIFVQPDIMWIASLTYGWFMPA